MKNACVLALVGFAAFSVLAAELSGKGQIAGSMVVVRSEPALDPSNEESRKALSRLGVKP